jgi:hypothetical protein
VDLFVTCGEIPKWINGLTRREAASCVCRKKEAAEQLIG